jgi:hypothetical protein
VLDVGVADGVGVGHELDRGERGRAFLRDDGCRPVARLPHGHAVRRVRLVDGLAVGAEQERELGGGDLGQRRRRVGAGRVDRPEAQLVVVAVAHDRHVDGLAAHFQVIRDVDVVAAPVDAVRTGRRAREIDCSSLPSRS